VNVLTLFRHNIISQLFCCLTTGTFPNDWKSAKVTPIFKQGGRSDMNQYRPISVISAIAKVFERIVYNQLSSYLSENNILSPYQSGFRSFHSTVTALLEATDNWAFNIDRGYVNAVVFLDLKKAFDTVNHPILLSKLYSYGVKGNAYELLSSYLDNRTQKCAVNGVLSKSCTLICGIPQGTILGPLLFLLYINDSPNYRWMLSFSSILNENGKSSIEALHYCKMILKSFKNNQNDFNIILQ